MLTGQAKADYQRDYMRRYRAKKGQSAVKGQKQRSENAPECPVTNELPVRPTVRPPESVRPVRPTELVRPVKPESVRPEQAYANAVLCEPVSSGCRGCKLMSYKPSEGMFCPAGRYATASAAIFEENINPYRDCTYE